jgi:D-glycero-D-manno-heptose 1,7-bisphosphate phosphatase
MIADPSHSRVLRVDTLAPETAKQHPLGDIRPMAVLDRDGVINLDHGYVCTPERFQWVDGVVEAIRRLNETGFRVVIATNQSGIARGLFTETEFEALTEWMAGELNARGARFDACFYCPHHPQARVREYGLLCECRKPAPGMIKAAMRLFPTDTRRSFLIGDRDTDVLAARSAGLRGLRYTGDPSIQALVDSAIADVRG